MLPSGKMMNKTFFIVKHTRQPYAGINLADQDFVPA